MSAPGAAVQEVQPVTGPLQGLVQRVRQLLEQFADNPLLGQLLQLAGRIQGAPPALLQPSLLCRW